MFAFLLLHPPAGAGNTLEPDTTMAVHHVEEHLNCYNYSRSGGPVEVLETYKGTRLSKDVRETELMCLISGKLKFATQHSREQVIGSGNIILLPPNTRATAEVLQDSYILVYVITKPIQLCDLCPLESLAESLPNAPEQPEASILKFNDRTSEYFRAFVNCLNEGLKCYHYLELKSQELMFILRGFYTRPELAMFFRPLISNDMGFSDFILKNYRNVKTVEELARLSNYSRSGFKAHFRKTFGTSASAWMRERKARDVYHELNSTSKSLQQISKEYNFSSVSHMSIFCKEYFNMPPGKIRKGSGKKSSVSGKFDPEAGVARLPRPKVRIDTAPVDSEK